MDNELVSDEQFYLRRLSLILNYALSTLILYFLEYAWQNTLVLVLVAAALFIPYMLYVFFRLKKIAWIISFVMVVILPLIICIILGLKFGFLDAFAFIPPGFFFFYCFVLKFSVSDQLKEISTRDELTRERG